MQDIIAFMKQGRKISVVGLGVVGLSVASAFAKKQRVIQGLPFGDCE